MVEHHLLPDATAADAELAQAEVAHRGPAPVRLVRFLWRSSQRVVVIGGGFALILGGVAMLVLPGPGLLVILAGLALLAREFVWAERMLDSAHRQAETGVSTAKRLLRRR